MTYRYLTDDEKCPSCNEDWEQGKGLNCANNCEHKQLEEKHRTVAKPMVDYCLPNWGVKVDCPNNWEEPREWERIKWGEAIDVAKKITVPWYTLRNKKMFFHTVCHETAHISAYDKKFEISTKKVLRDFEILREEHQKSPPNSSERKFVESQIISYIDKHKKHFLKYIKEMETPKRGHWEDPWYSDYVEFFNKLLKSDFAEYAYNNKTPLPYKKSFDEED